MSAQATKAKQREAFEHWFSDGWKWSKAVARGEDGHYLLAQAHVSYEAWQAAADALHQADLLQMLHECAEYIAALNGEQDDYCQRARALIARATGEVK